MSTSKHFWDDLRKREALAADAHDARSVDATPTWESLMPVLVGAAAEGNTDAMLELIKLARVVDKHIAELGAIRDALPPAPRADSVRGDKDGYRLDVCPDCGIRGSHALGCPLGPEPYTDRQG